MRPRCASPCNAGRADCVARVRLPLRNRAARKGHWVTSGVGRGYPAWGLTSECKFQTGLHDSRQNCAYARNLSEVSIAHGVIGIGKARRIESIEHLPAELEAVALVHVPVLRDHRIHSLDGWTLEHVFAAVTEGTHGVIGERCGIKILIQPLSLATRSHIQGLAGNDVGTIFEL